MFSQEILISRKLSLNKLYNKMRGVYMNLLKNFFKNDSTVVGLCDLRRRQAVNSFTFAQNFAFTQPVFERPTPIFAGQRIYQ